MYNLDSVGIVLLFVAIILGGGIFLMAGNRLTRKTVKKKLSLAASPDDKMETATELLPDIQFPPDIIHEHVPDLPPGYNDDRMVIMARDPEWVFAYWNISEEKHRMLQNTYGPGWNNAVPVLRVYDVTGVSRFNGFNANRYYDVVIDEMAGSWYLHVGEPDRTYCVDLGRILRDGTYVVVMRSNFAATPRNTLSDKTDPQWMLVSDKERRLYERMAGSGGMSSYELFRQRQ